MNQLISACMQFKFNFEYCIDYNNSLQFEKK